VGLREEKKRQQRQEILDGALALIRERGYDNTRVQDIVERTGISEGTFFNYFATKESLLHDFALVHIDIYSGALQHELEAANVPVPDRIRELIKAAALAIEADRAFQEVIYTRSDLFNASGLLREKTLLMYDQLAELFRLGQERGEISESVDPMQLAEVMTGIYHLTTLNWLTGWWEDETADLDTRLSNAVGVFLDGCRPR
jgi:AcrR family transcriptional regulator